MTAIMIVEDDRMLNEGLAFALEKEGYDIIQAYSAGEALTVWYSLDLHLLILDINLPDRSGIELCKEIRKISEVPVLFLTANDTDQDIVRGFQSGADDYIAKPFSMAVLSQRVKAVLRRRGDDRPERFVYKDLTIYYDKMKVFKSGAELKLTSTEFKLLAVLTRGSKQIMTRQMIVEQMWDIDGAFVDENTLSVNIKRLRDKIEDDPKNSAYIKTVFGIGYTWGD